MLYKTIQSTSLFLKFSQKKKKCIEELRSKARERERERQSK